MTGYHRAGLALLVLAVPMSLNAQTEVGARNVTLVGIGSGEFAEANADGTQALDPYAVPAGKELCLKDISWHVVGAADADVELGLRNNNLDGTSSWVIWWIHPKLNSKGAAGGATTVYCGAADHGRRRTRVLRPGPDGCPTRHLRDRTFRDDSRS